MSAAGSSGEAAFLWGAATSAHQVEGGNRNSDWWRAEIEGRLPERSGRACDHWTRFREDFDLARRLGHRAHRFSIEWSRIEPRPGAYDEEALAHYDAVIDALVERGIEPVVTLFHFTLPVWLAERDGWHGPLAEAAFLRFVERAAERFGDRVRWWIPLNEPMIYAWHGYFEGKWPPFLTDPKRGFRALRNQARAHVRAHAGIHEIYRRRGLPAPGVGLAKAAVSFAPCDPGRLGDRFAAAFGDRIFNRLFVDAVHSGWLIFPGVFWERLPGRRALDFLGLNYYTRQHVRGGRSKTRMPGGVCPPEHHPEVPWRNGLGWEVRPEGMGEHLRRWRRLDRPLWITENGICTEDDGARTRFLDAHLAVLARARADGVPVRAYLHWSMLDNYEWADGYGPRFGLVEVDYETLERRPRPSAERFAAWIRGEIDSFATEPLNSGAPRR